MQAESMQIISNPEKGNPCKITVGIPVFNCEAYIEECLDSVRAQSLLDIEIVCVNDGSLDDSASILEEYSRMDSRMRIINSTVNRGVSASRNQIILEAKGEYLYFLDGDDCLYENALTEMYSMAKENNLDILTFNSEFFPSVELLSLDGRKNPKLKGNYDGVLTGQEFFCRMNENGEYRVMMGRYLFRKAFLDENSLKFKENIKCYEDAPFSFACLLLATRVSYINKTYHGYRIRPGSIVSGSTAYNRYIGFFLGYAAKIEFLQQYFTHDPRLLAVIQKRLNRARKNAQTYFFQLGKEEKGRELHSDNYFETELFRLFTKASKQDVTLSKLKRLRVEDIKSKQHIEQLTMENNNLKIQLASKTNQLNKIKNSRGWKVILLFRRIIKFMHRKK